MQSKKEEKNRSSSYSASLSTSRFVAYSI